MRRRLLLLALGAAILAVLWLQTGWGELADLVEGLRPGWLVAALVLLVAQVWLSAIRWRAAARMATHLPVPRACLQVISVEALNVLLPSRTGDLAKGVFLARERHGISPGVGVGLAAIEKWVDTTAFVVLVVVLGIAAPPADRMGLLLLLGTAAMGVVSIGLLYSPAAQWMAHRQPNSGGGLWSRLRRTAGEAGELLVTFRSAPGRIPWLFALSLFMWVLLLLQLSWVLRALGVDGPGTSLIWSRSLLAILVGMLPLTPAGIGTRDAAFLYFLGPAIGSAAALGLGAFLALRYLLLSGVGLLVLPLIGGLPEGSRVSMPSRRKPDA